MTDIRVQRELDALDEAVRSTRVRQPRISEYLDELRTLLMSWPWMQAQLQEMQQRLLSLEQGEDDDEQVAAASGSERLLRLVQNQRLTARENQNLRAREHFYQRFVSAADAYQEGPHGEENVLVQELHAGDEYEVSRQLLKDLPAVLPCWGCATLKLQVQELLEVIEPLATLQVPGLDLTGAAQPCVCHLLPSETKEQPCVWCRLRAVYARYKKTEA